MTDSIQEPVTNPDATASAGVEPSLDDIIAEYAVQAPAAPATPSMVATPAPSTGTPSFDLPPNIDFMDPNQVQGFVKKVAEGQSALYSQLNAMQAELSESRQRQAALQVETEIKSAVSKVAEGLELDPRVVRVHLELMAQEKPGFKRLWESRHENPQAFDKALKAVKSDLSKLYAVRQDPDLAATQAALRQSQRTLASRPVAASKNPIEDALANAKTDAEFETIWNQVSRASG